MNKTAGFVFAVIVFFVATLAQAAGLNWTNTLGGDWNNALNWSPNQVPATGDDIIITNSGTYTITNAVGVTVGHLTLGGTNGIQTLTLNSLSMTNSGLVNSNGFLNWSGGDLSGSLKVAPGGTLAISNNVTFSYVNPQYSYTNTAYLTNYGTVIWSGAIACYANPSGHGGGGVIYNAGLWEAVTDNSLTVNYGGTNLFINTGTLTKIGGTVVSSINWDVSSSGLLATPSGSFSLNFAGTSLIHGLVNLSSSSLSGAATIESNAVINWSGSSINGALNIASNSILNWSGGDLSGALTVAQGGLLTISNNVIFSYVNAQYSYTNTAYLTNYGTVIWSGPIASYANPSGHGGGGVIYNSGLWNVVTDNSMTANYGGTNLFINTGTLAKIGGTAASSINWGFSSSGVINTPSGSFVLNWSSPSTLHGNATLSGGLLGFPLLVASNAVLNLSGVDLAGALTVAQGGTLTISNNITFSYVNAQYSYTNTAYLTNYGTVIWSGSIASYANPSGFGGGALLYNAGLWEAVTDNNLTANYGGTNLFINTGILTKIGGAGTSTINWDFNDLAGTITTPVGYFTFNGAWGGNSLVNGNATIAGNLGGIIASNATVIWQGGDLENSLTVAQGGTLVLSNSITFSYFNAQYSYTNTAHLTNYGTVIWAGSITSYANPSGFGGGGFINNYGVWEATTDNNLTSNYGGTNLFINTGILTKVGGSGASGIGWSYGNDQGTITTLAGYFNFNGAWNGNQLVFGTALVTGNVGGIIGSNANITLIGGNIDSSLTVAQGGTLAISNSVTMSYGNAQYSYTNTAYLTNYGTVIWAGSITSYGNPSGYGGGGIIYNAGLWKAVSDTSIGFNYGGTNLLVNKGTLVKIGGTATSTINWNLRNQGGILSSQTNTLALTGNYDLSGGTLNAGINSDTSFGKIQLGGSPVLLEGTLSVNFNNGYIAPTGSSFPILTYAAENGLFTNASLPFAVAWQTNYGSTAFSVTVLNVRPVLTPVASQNLDELTLLNLLASATDMDAGQSLSYALVSGPSGLSISTSGAIAWTPSETQGPSSNTVLFKVTDNGTPALSATNSFLVTVNEINVSSQLLVPVSQSMNELTTLNVSASATDSDIPINPLTFALVSPPTGMSINPNTGAISWSPTEAQGPGIYPITIVVTDLNTNAINQQSFSVTNSFTVTVNEVNVPPQLNLPPNISINELTSYSANVTAVDSDIPANPLIFNLVSGPAGLTVSPGGAVSWTPTEAQGPSTNTVTISVTDTNPAAVNATALSVTNSYQIIVNEVNTAPVLTLPPNTNVDELTTYTAAVTATDSDVPTNLLTFRLVSGPSGLTLSPGGTISWTPTEAQGPSTNTVTISVTDTNPVAINATALSVTNSFQIIVNEVNTAPVLATILDRTVNAGQIVSFTATATDSDIPTNSLTFSLLSGPPGANISSNGVFNWRPAIAQANTTNLVRLVVTDFNPYTTNINNQHLTNAQSFTIKVNPLAPVILMPLGYTNGHFTLQVNGTTGPDYIISASTNLTQWNDLFTNFSPVVPFQYTNLNGFNLQFYRARLLP